MVDSPTVVNFGAGNCPVAGACCVRGSAVVYGRSSYLPSVTTEGLPPCHDGRLSRGAQPPSKSKSPFATPKYAALLKKLKRDVVSLARRSDAALLEAGSLARGLTGKPIRAVKAELGAIDAAIKKITLRIQSLLTKYAVKAEHAVTLIQALNVVQLTVQKARAALHQCAKRKRREAQRAKESMKAQERAAKAKLAREKKQARRRKAAEAATKKAKAAAAKKAAEAAKAKAKAAAAKRRRAEKAAKKAKEAEQKAKKAKKALKKAKKTKKAAVNVTKAALPLKGQYLKLMTELFKKKSPAAKTATFPATRTSAKVNAFPATPTVAKATSTKKSKYKMKCDGKNKRCCASLEQGRPVVLSDGAVQYSFTVSEDMPACAVSTWTGSNTEARIDRTDDGSSAAVDPAGPAVDVTTLAPPGDSLAVSVSHVGDHGDVADFAVPTHTFVVGKKQAAVRLRMDA